MHPVLYFRGEATVGESNCVSSGALVEGASKQKNGVSAWQGMGGLHVADMISMLFSIFNVAVLI